MKKLSLLLLIVFLSILTYVVATAPTVTYLSPADGAYELNDTIYFNCSGEPTSQKEILVHDNGTTTYNLSLEYKLFNGSEWISAWNGSEYNDSWDRSTIDSWNITNITFWHNATGTWHMNQSSSVVSTFNETTGYKFHVHDVPDHTWFIWDCQIVEQNQSKYVNSTMGGSNRTVYAERPPKTILDIPVDGYNSSSEIVTINFTMITTHINDDKAICRLYTNESAPDINWSVHKDYLRNDSICPINASHPLCGKYEFDYQFPDDTTTKYGLYCYESLNEHNIYAFSDANKTVTVDTTDPVVSIWSGNSYSTGTYTWKFSAVDTNLVACDFYLNKTVNWSKIPTFVLNTTNTTTGTSWNKSLTFTGLLDGNWTVYLDCNDSAGNRGNSSFQWLYVNTTYPSINEDTLTNLTRGCNDMILNFTQLAIVNATANWGNSSGSLTATIKSTDFLNEHLFNFSNLNTRQIYYYNVTFCNRAGCCNDTQEQSFMFPYKICAGWTLYGMWDYSNTLGNVGTNSSAEYVYWWNATSQSWKYWSSGVTTSANHKLRFGDVIHLYHSSGITWGGTTKVTGTGSYRNVSVQEPYFRNLTVGDNWVALWRNRTIGDLITDFMNDSNDWSLGYTRASLTPENLAFNITDISVFNNSAHEYTLPYVYNSSWNNNTYVGNLTDFEAMWVWTDWNVSWNGTCIYGNWS